MKLTIGSRGSALALWQANWVRDRLVESGHEVEVIVIKTSGDRMHNVQLDASGVKGLFIKEIEEALLDHKADIAVHSLKDLPTEQPSGLTLGAVPEREDARDAFLSRSGVAFDQLPKGTRIGTGSVRRRSQLRHLRSDVEYVAIRGNVDTRLRKLDEGEYDALVLAAAGLNRLGFAARVTAVFSPAEICPAVGQGALGIQIRKNDHVAADAVAPLDDPRTHAAVRAERALLGRLGGGCSVPIAAYAVPGEEGLHLQAVVARPDGEQLLRAEATGSADAAEELGIRVAEGLLRQGAAELLETE